MDHDDPLEHLVRRPSVLGRALLDATSFLSRPGPADRGSDMRRARVSIPLYSIGPSGIGGPYQIESSDRGPAPGLTHGRATRRPTPFDSHGPGRR